MTKKVTLSILALCSVMVAIATYVILSQQRGKSGEQTVKEAIKSSQQLKDPTKHEYEDVDFAKKMVLVDQQAMQIADIGTKKATDNDVRDIADKAFSEAQNNSQRYITLLEQWNETYLNLTDFPEMEGHDMYPTFSGMMTLSKIRTLEALTGREFDVALLNLLIEHHQGVLSFQTDQNGEVSGVGNAEILKLITEYVQNQKQQITALEKLRKD